MDQQEASCDSLSNLYLWHIKYSFANQIQIWKPVVIRFQICIFDILNTADVFVKNSSGSCDSLSNLYLWHIKYSKGISDSPPIVVVIRFQICIFDILNTANWSVGDVITRCDSLSNLYLWHIKYSIRRYFKNIHRVVIRFQICIFDILNTAHSYCEFKKKRLWFAFKFVSLTY